MAYTPLSDVQDGESLGANLWNTMSRATGIGVGMVAEVGDFITAAGCMTHPSCPPQPIPAGKFWRRWGTTRAG